MGLVRKQDAFTLLPSPLSLFFPSFFPLPPLLPHSTFGRSFHLSCRAFFFFLKLSPSCLFYFLSSGFLFCLAICLFSTASFLPLLVGGVFAIKTGNRLFRHFRFFFLFRQKSCCYNLCPLPPLFFFCLPVVLPPTERALLPRAKSPVLLSRDRQRTRLPPLPQHRLQRPEAGEHPAGLAGTHHPYGFRPLQGEH